MTATDDIPRTNPYLGVPRVPQVVDLAAMAGDREIELELGFGRGQFILARAAKRPQSLFVGVETRRKWVGVVGARAERAKLDNVIVWHGDARSSLRGFGPDASVSWVFVHFPDPWWKKRHGKRLLLVRDTVSQIARLLRPGGKLLVQTDVEERSVAYRAVLEGELRLAAAPGALESSPVEQPSHRERKCLAAGLPVHRLLYEKL